jgi:hypothetical protein
LPTSLVIAGLDPAIHDDCRNHEGGLKMDIEIARHVTRSVFSCTRELGGLVPFLKEYLNADEYPTYAQALASAIYAIQHEILDKLEADHPLLKAEIEASMKKYERYL